MNGRTALDAERLGAQVLRQGDTGWTREALVRHPQGAVFTASQFTPANWLSDCRSPGPTAPALP